MRVRKLLRRFFRQVGSSLQKLLWTMRQHLWAAIFGFLLIGYSVFTLLYAFVLPHNVVAMDAADYVEIEKQEPVSIHPVTEEEEEEADTKPQITRTSYVTSDVDIQISEIRAYDTAIYAADVIIQDPELLRTGLAEGKFGRNVYETTSRIASEEDAVLAINGDYYGLRNDGFVLRNGYLYRSNKRSGDENEDLVIYQDGTMEIVKEKITDIQTLISDGAVQILSCGPGLIADGEITVEENTSDARAANSNPRTAIGYVPPREIEVEESEVEEESEEGGSGEGESEEQGSEEEDQTGDGSGEGGTEDDGEEKEVVYEEGNHYVLLVADGRSSESAGLTLYELAEVMQSLGCTQAYNLDGGSATTMYFNGRVVNNPATNSSDGEKGVSDIVYIEK